MKNTCMFNKYSRKEDNQMIQAPERTTCPGKHVLSSFSTPDAEFSCDVCRTVFRTGTHMYGCRECDWDICEKCVTSKTQVS